MSDPFQQDIQAMYALADTSSSLSELIPSLYETLRNNEASLRGVTYAYRLHANDTGFETAFAAEMPSKTTEAGSDPSS